MALHIVKNSLLGVGADALVLSANPSLLAGGGISGLLHKAAGRELENEALTHGPIKAGESVVTRGYKLSCKYVIHTVCPRHMYGSQQERDLLSAAYKSALDCYNEISDAKRIAFASMGTGIYGWPIELAAQIAVKELLNSRFEETYMCLVDAETTNSYQTAFNNIIGARPF